MSISLLEKLAGKTEEFDVDYSGMKISFRTLSQKEMDEITAGNPFGNLELNVVPLLARAIVSIDGQKFEAYSEFTSIEDKEDKKVSDVTKKEKILEEMDSIVIGELFRLYSEGREKILKKKLQKTKKNSKSSLTAD